MKTIVACLLSLCAAAVMAQETTNPCATLPRQSAKPGVIVPNFVQPDPSPTVADLASSAAGILWLRLSEVRELNVERISGGVAPSAGSANAPVQRRDSAKRPPNWYVVSGSVRFTKGQAGAPDVASVNATLYECGGTAPAVLYGRQREFPLERAFLELSTLGDLFAVLLQGKMKPVSAEVRPSPSNVSRGEIQNRAEALLCVSKDPSCAPNPDGAVKLLAPLAADLKRPLTDPYLLFLLGKAQLASKHELDASATLGLAVKHLAGRPGKGSTAPASESYQLELLTLAGDASAAAGSYRAAAQYYKRSLGISPQQANIAAKYIRALRFSGVPVDALRAGLAQLKVTDVPEIHNELIQGIADLNVQDLAKSVTVLREALQQRHPVNEEYAFAMARAAGELLRANPRDTTAMSYLTQAVQLQAQKPRVLAYIYGYLAEAHLETRDYTAVERDLQSLDNLPRQELTNVLQEWIERERATYYLRQQRYDDAVAAAEHARTLNPTSDAANLLRARIYVAQASHGGGGGRSANLAEGVRVSSQLAAKRFAGADEVYVQAASASGQTSPALQLYQRLLKENPQDFSAASSMVTLCAAMKNRSCAEPAMDAFVAKIPEDDVNTKELSAAEVLTLKGNFADAGRELESIVTSRKTPPEFRTVGRYYQVWIALAGCTADVKQRHAALAAARLEATSAGKWEFSWARTLLPVQNFGPEKTDYLTKASEVLEGVTDTELPKLPHSCEAPLAAENPGAISHLPRDEGGKSEVRSAKLEVKKDL